MENMVFDVPIMDIDIKLKVVVDGLGTSTALRHDADLRFSLKTVISALEVLEAETAFCFLFFRCWRCFDKVSSSVVVVVVVSVSLHRLF